MRNFEKKTIQKFQFQKDLLFKMKFLISFRSETKQTSSKRKLKNTKMIKFKTKRNL